jgi:hypothetical protein
MSANRGYLGRLGKGVQTLVGSRFFVGVSALTMTAFLAHVLNAPDRFPQFAVINFQTMGILPPPPPGPDLPQLGETARAAVDGAKAAGLPYLQAWLDVQSAKAGAWFAAHPGAVVLGNHIGLAVSGMTTLLGAYLLARQMRS